MKTFGPAGGPTDPNELVPKSYVDLGDRLPMYVPADYGAIAWTMDPAVSSAAAPLTGRAYYARVKIAKSGTISNLSIFVSAAAATQTHGFLGIYSLAGVQLAVTADQTTSWQSTGLKTVALVTPLAVNAGDEVLFMYLCTATTAATIAAAPSSPGTNMLLSAASPLRAGILAATGLTALPSPAIMTGAGTNSNLPVIIAT